MNLLERLKQLFKKKDKVNPEELVPVEVVPEKKVVYKRIALLVGHDKSAKGAISYPVNNVGIREYDWNSERALEIKEMMDQKYPDKDVRIFYRDGIGRTGAAQMIGKWKADLSLELHFNSIGHEKDAFGSEMLILDKDDLSADIGFSLIEEVSRQFKTKLRGRYTNKELKDYRGIKALKKGDRGYENLSVIKDNNVPVRLLIEPFFAGTKTEESKQFMEDPKKYSRVLGSFLGQLP